MRLRYLVLPLIVSVAFSGSALRASEPIAELLGLEQKIDRYIEIYKAGSNGPFAELEQGSLRKEISEEILSSAVNYGRNLKIIDDRYLENPEAVDELQSQIIDDWNTNYLTDYLIQDDRSFSLLKAPLELLLLVGTSITGFGTQGIMRNPTKIIPTVATLGGMVLPTSGGVYGTVEMTKGLQHAWIPPHPAEFLRYGQAAECQMISQERVNKFMREFDAEIKGNSVAIGSAALRAAMRARKAAKVMGCAAAAGVALSETGVGALEGVGALIIREILLYYVTEKMVEATAVAWNDSRVRNFYVNSVKEAVKKFQAIPLSDRAAKLQAAHHLKWAALKLDTYWNFDFVSDLTRQMNPRLSNKSSIEETLRYLGQIEDTRARRKFFARYLRYLLHDVGPEALNASARDLLRMTNPFQSGQLRNPLDDSEQGYEAFRRRIHWIRGVVGTNAGVILREFQNKAKREQIPLERGGIEFGKELDRQDEAFYHQVFKDYRYAGFSESPTLMLYQAAAVIQVGSGGDSAFNFPIRELRNRAARVLLMIGLDTRL